jgi:hypothetical protein
MKFKEIAERLELLNRTLGSKALGYRLRRELKKIVTQYEKDINLVQGMYNSGDRK